MRTSRDIVEVQGEDHQNLPTQEQVLQHRNNEVPPEAPAQLPPHLPEVLPDPQLEAPPLQNPHHEVLPEEALAMNLCSEWHSEREVQDQEAALVQDQGVQEEVEVLAEAAEVLAEVLAEAFADVVVLAVEVLAEAVEVHQQELAVASNQVAPKAHPEDL